MSAGTKPVRFRVTQGICRWLPPLFSQRLRLLMYPAQKAYHDDYPFVVRAHTGSLFKSITSNFPGYSFGIHGYFTWRNWAIAIALCRPGDTIVEVGANVGTETIGFADIVGRSGKVYAFEPLPSNIMALRETVRLNAADHVSIMPFAVGDECRTVRFCIPPTDYASDIGHVVLDESAPRVSDTMIDVQCVTLDSLMDRIRPVRMLFVDAEGADLPVVRGARQLIRADKPAIVLEANPRLLSRSGFTLRDLHAEIIALDYEAHRISRLGLVPPDLEEQSRTTNWFCVHAEQRNVTRIITRLIRACGLLPCVPKLNPLTRPRYTGASAGNMPNPRLEDTL